MYHFLGQDNPDTAEYEESVVNSGDETAAQITNQGGAVSIVNPVTGEVVGQSSVPTTTIDTGTALIFPISAASSSSVSSPASKTSVPKTTAISSPVTTTALELAPGVYANPQTLASTVAAATGTTTSSFTTWLSQTTGGVKNQTLLLGGLAAFPAMLLITAPKKKRR